MPENFLRRSKEIQIFVYCISIISVSFWPGFYRILTSGVLYHLFTWKIYELLKIRNTLAHIMTAFAFIKKPWITNKNRYIQRNTNSDTHDNWFYEVLMRNKSDIVNFAPQFKEYGKIVAYDECDASNKMHRMIGVD
ncbi:hypothetical protein ACVLD2_001000 [Paenibacillus sp. PvR052]|nr:hypothetical protein [Paenibacillus sp. PvP091]MBP1169522.1 hypothetical protein [Paenibacillus sp. PvR098]MBP2440550.1 hypothetical protein [Paenibacillus sp. PvP052]